MTAASIQKSAPVPRWRLRLECWWRGHLLIKPYCVQNCARCGRKFGNLKSRGQISSAHPVSGALARSEALAAGYPDWPAVTRWPLTGAADDLDTFIAGHLRDRAHLASADRAFDDLRDQVREIEAALHRVMDERNDALRRIDQALALCEEELQSGGPGTYALNCFPVRVRTALEPGQRESS